MHFNVEFNVQREGWREVTQDEFNRRLAVVNYRRSGWTDGISYIDQRDRATVAFEADLVGRYYVGPDLQD